MIKNIPPRSWPQFDGPQMEVVKVAHDGFRGVDFSEFVKLASHPLAAWVRSNPPQAGEVYVHNVALGAHEKVGLNRNADGYSHVMLTRDHPTFEKCARFYMNHRNTDPTKSIGIIKKSYYNPELGRVDLINALNSTPQAAARNNGLVAERTLQKLASGQDVATSQSCKVGFDVCLSCGNKAKHRSEYCGPELCKYGGCRDNLGRVFDDGFHLGVDNPHCTFFDNSDVSDTRGADRTAFITGKVAASDRVIGGAELAEKLGLTTPEYLLDRNVLAVMRCLRKVAESVHYSIEAAPSWDECVRIRDKQSYAKSSELVFPSGDYNRKELLLELGSAGVILPPSRWLSCATGVDYRKCASVFGYGIDPRNDLLNRNDVEDVISDSPALLADNRLSALKKWAWLIPTPLAHAVESSIGVIALSDPENAAIKAASTGVPSNVVAEAKSRYLAYQGRILASHENSGIFPLLIAECVRHNRNNTV